MFSTWNGNEWHYSWKHPVPEFDEAKYLLPDEVHSGDPKYEALSYVWGTEALSKLIAVEDIGENKDESTRIPSEKSRNIPVTLSHLRIETGPAFKNHAPAVNKQSGGIGKFRVRSNLWMALKHLRHSDATRTLWIDAICINQDDDSEKGTQVHRMADIYRLAHRVVVWMGLLPDECHAAETLQTLQYLAAQVVTFGTIDGPSPGAAEKLWWRPDHALPYNSVTWSSIAALLDNSYTFRVWPVQEVGLANRLAVMQWGHSVVSVTDFSRALRTVYQKRTLPDVKGLTESLGPMTQMLHVMIGLPLGELLRLSTNRQCADPRDKVFGILGLLPPEIADLIKPDYNAACSTVEVFRRTFLEYSKHVRRLDLLVSYRDPDEALDWPSWLLNWSKPPGYSMSLKGQFFAGYSGAHFSYKKLDTLVVTGVKCAVVKEVSKPLEGDFVSICGQVGSFLSDEGSEATYVGGCSLLEAYAVAICGWGVNDRWKRVLSFSPLNEWVGEVKRAGGGPIVGYIPSNALMVDACVCRCKERRLFKTRNHFVGLGPTRVQPGMFYQHPYLNRFRISANVLHVGDVVAGFLGADSAKVLRLVTEGQYRVVGDCLVPGLMDCTAFLGPLPKPWTVYGDTGYKTRNRFEFFNTETNESTIEDPRLEPLEGTGWERMDYEPRDADPDLFDYFRNKKTGEVMNSDPRLLPENLKARGVPLEEFELV